MTTHDACPDPMILSQLFDSELSATEDRDIRAHLDGCSDCQTRLDRMADTDAMARRSLSGEPIHTARPADPCLTPSRIAGYAAGALEGAILKTAERHLGQCDDCLQEVRQAFQMDRRLQEGPREAVPEALIRRMESRFGVAAAQDAPSLTEVVVKVVRRGVELVSQEVVAPLMGFEPLTVQSAMVRSSDAATPLSFKLKGTGADIEATVMPEGEAVSLKLLIRSGGDQAVSGERVFLRRHGRSIFSAKTNDVGELHTPRLEPGVYEVSCTGIQTSFRLDLRS